ncbi:MAG: hypothetical protein FJ303_15100 [Planctomycetes bacterium]|nr:hypothetical protein [Planctomycetota bacterium]
MAQLVSTPGTPVPVDPCPRCKKPLVDPHGLGWCKACGYCKSLEESGKKAETVPDPVPANAPQDTISATGWAISETPLWFWIMLVGVLVVVGATFAAGRWLPLTPFQRALFTTIQIGAGLGIAFLGQFIALMMLAPDETSLTFKDAVFPFYLYTLVFKHLPKTQFTIYFATWGTAAIVAAAIFIGGLGHWFTYLPGNHKGPAKQGQAAQSPK